MREAERERRRAQMAALYDLADVHQAVQRHLAAGFAEHGLDDITPPQSVVLAVLFEEQVATTARLAARLGLADVTVGRFVAALERAGYVHRTPNPDDARELLVRPTAKARRRLPTFIAVTNDLLDRLFADEDMAVIGGFLERARARLAGPAAAPGHRLLPVCRGGG